MGLLSAFSQNPQFQQQLSGIMGQMSPGFAAPQRMQPQPLPAGLNPGGGIGGGAMTPDMVRQQGPGLQPLSQMDFSQFQNALGGSDMLRYAQLPNIMRMPGF